MMKKQIITVATIVAVTMIGQADIFKTGFAGRTTDNGTDTISNIAWTGDDISSLPSSLVIAGTVNFVNVGSGNDEVGDPVGVAKNIKNGGTWNTSFAFTPTATISPSNFKISSYSISGGGAHQTRSHDVSWTLDISDGSGSIFTDTQRLTEPGGADPANFSFNTSSVTLDSGSAYTFKVTVFSVTETGGNNIALNSVALVPEPATLGLVLAFGSGIAFLRRYMR